MDKTASQNRTIILIAPEFDEEMVVHCVKYGIGKQPSNSWGPLQI
jgi:hypothetical protein